MSRGSRLRNSETHQNKLPSGVSYWCVAPCPLFEAPEATHLTARVVLCLSSVYRDVVGVQQLANAVDRSQMIVLRANFISKCAHPELQVGRACAALPARGWFAITSYVWHDVLGRGKHSARLTLARTRCSQKPCCMLLNPGCGWAAAGGCQQRGVADGVHTIHRQAPGTGFHRVNQVVLLTVLAEIMFAGPACCCRTWRSVQQRRGTHTSRSQLPTWQPCRCCTKECSLVSVCIVVQGQPRQSLASVCNSSVLSASECIRICLLQACVSTSSISNPALEL
jgi:hypothetical protein